MKSFRFACALLVSATFACTPAETPVEPDGSRAFFEGVAISGSDLRIYPKLRHEIFNEPEREQVYLDVLEWLGGLPEPANEE